jgi:hypothetical protein
MKHELYFTFPIRLSREQEDVFIGYVLAIRDSQVLDKLRLARAQAKIQAKIPFNPSKPIMEGMIAQFDAIEANINNLFMLEPVVAETSKYRLTLSTSLNVNNPLAKSSKVEHILKAMSKNDWTSLFLKEMNVESVKISGEE